VDYLLGVVHVLSAPGSWLNRLSLEVFSQTEFREIWSRYLIIFRGQGRSTLVSTSEEDNFAPVLAAAGRALTTTMMAKVAGCGFTDVTPAFASLLLLLDATGARPTALAQQAGITKQAISQLVRELEARDYVEQVPDPTDTRAKLVRLTKNGVSLRVACAGAKHELHSIAIARLGESRVSQLRQDLIELTDALEEMRTR
jgi:DNA-binding MarR family transcriptional regulator